MHLLGSWVVWLIHDGKHGREGMRGAKGKNCRDSTASRRTILFSCDQKGLPWLFFVAFPCFITTAAVTSKSKRLTRMERSRRSGRSSSYPFAVWWHLGATNIWYELQLNLETSYYLWCIVGKFNAKLLLLCVELGSSLHFLSITWKLCELYGCNQVPRVLRWRQPSSQKLEAGLPGGTLHCSSRPTQAQPWNVGPLCSCGLGSTPCP